MTSSSLHVAYESMVAYLLCFLVRAVDLDVLLLSQKIMQFSLQI